MEDTSKAGFPPIVVHVAPISERIRQALSSCAFIMGAIVGAAILDVKDFFNLISHPFHVRFDVVHGRLDGCVSK